MGRFGIQDYEPDWLSGREAVTAAHGERLAHLAGRTLQHIWLVWDRRADEWFPDAPVLLDLGDERVSVDHQKFDDLCLTWDTLDPARTIEDAGEDWPFDLVWRPEPTPQLAELAGRTLHGVQLLVRAGGRHDLADQSVAIGLDLAPDWLTVFNAMDENGLAAGPPDSRYRRHPVSRPDGRRPVRTMSR
jgi:hypothetical protein